METLQPKLRFPEFKGDWEEKQINKILSIGSGRDYKHLKEGNIPVFGTGGLMTKVDNYLYEGETVCIGRKGTIDRPMYYNGKIWTVDTLFYTHSFINSKPKFIYNLFQNINWKIHSEASGVPSLSKTTIEKLSIKIPLLEEQTKIAQFLTEIDNKLNQLTQKKTLLEQYKKGVMQKIFNQELRFKDENGNYYKDWEEKTLKDVATITTGSTPSTFVVEFYGGDKQLVSPADIQTNRYIIKTNTTLTNLGFSKTRKIKKGSVLFVCIGSTIGKTAQTIEDCATNQQINSLYAFDENENDFIYSLLEYNGNKIKLLAGIQAVPQINKTEFSNIKYSFPQKEEQTKIGNFLSAIDVKINQVGVQLDKTKEFKKGLLQQMFV